MIEQRWPGVEVINTFGNNDNMIDYVPPYTRAQRRNIYGSLFKTWFRDKPQMMLNKNNNMVKLRSDFMNGGKFQYNLNEKLAIISMNSNYFKHDEYSKFRHECDYQLDWFN